MRISDWSSDVCSSDLGQRSRAGLDRPALESSFNLDETRAEPSKRLVVNLVDLVDLASDGVRYGVHALIVVKHPADFAPSCAVAIDRGATDIFNHHEGELAAQAAGLQLLHRSEEHTYELQSLIRISYAVI